MSYKKGKSVESLCSTQIPTEDIHSVNIQKYCSKKLFEIVIANAATENDEICIKNLINSNKFSAKSSCISFITISDVKNFIEIFSSSDLPFNEIYPPNLVHDLDNFFTECKNLNNLNNSDLSKAIKYKLLHVMYNQYANCVIKNRQLKKTEELLNNLMETKTPKFSNEKEKNKANLIRKSESVKSKNHLLDLLAYEDYSQTEIIENNMIVEDDIQDHINFYVIINISNSKIISHLFELGLEISAIIQISKINQNEKFGTTCFWKEMEHIFLENDPHKQFSKTAFLKFVPRTEEVSIKQINEFFVILQLIINLKQSHKLYLKNMWLINCDITNKGKQFYEIYDSILKPYPMETLTIPFILNAMIQDIHITNEKSLDFKFNTSTKSNKKQDEIKVKHIKKPFRVYKGDVLNLFLQSYAEINKQYLKDNMHILNLQNACSFFQRYDLKEMELEESHTHSTFSPNFKTSFISDELADQLINLIYLHKTSERYIQPKRQENDKIFLYDSIKILENVKPKDLDESGNNLKKLYTYNSSENLYSLPKSVDYHWQEIISKEVFSQYIFKCELNFNYKETNYCPMTNTLIVKYHDDFNAFGVNTKVWDSTLRTPVHFGEFCRYIMAEDSDWIESNLPRSHTTYTEFIKTYEDETMERLMNVDIFENYRHLLSPEIQNSSTDVRINCICSDNKCQQKTYHQCDVSSSNLLNDKHLCLSEIILQINEYNQMNPKQIALQNTPNQRFVAYDLDDHRFSLVGFRNHFQSHDGMSVSIDTCRFRTEKFKMTTKISTEEVDVFLHYPLQDKFYFHAVLSNQTILVVEKNESVLSRTSFSPTEIPFVTESKQSGFSPSKNDLMEEEPTVVSIDYDRYVALNLFPLSGNAIRMSPSYRLYSNIKKDTKMLRLLCHSKKLMKISKRQKNKYLKKNNLEINVSVGKIARRILNMPKNFVFYQMYQRKHCKLLNYTTSNNSYAFSYRAMLPNGLRLESIPSSITFDSIAIKQQYIENSIPKEIIYENYRTFTAEGIIIIRKIDGSFCLLTSSGYIIQFSVSQKNKNTKCPLSDQYFLKKLLKIIPTNFEDSTAFSTFVSRRGSLRSRKGSFVNCKIFNQLKKFPFNRFSILSPNGCETTFKNGKMVSRHLHNLIQVANHQTHNIFSHREDNFNLSFYQDGTQIVKFPDGSIIKTSVFESTVSISKDDKEGWIILTTNFVFEHQFYTSVSFNNVKESVEVFLNEHSVLNISKDVAFLQDQNNYLLKITRKELKFTKTCPFCMLSCVCNLNITKLYDKEKPNDNEAFLDITDSYDKKFRSNFCGKCCINTNFITGPLNKHNCNHFMSRNYQKVFFVNENSEPILLRSDNFIMANIKDFDENKHLCRYNFENKLKFITLLKDIYVKYDQRFFYGTPYLTEFSSNKSELGRSSSKPLEYQIVQNVYRMFEIDQIKDLLKVLKTFFRPEVKFNLEANFTAIEKSLRLSKSINSVQSRISGKSEKITNNSFTLRDKLAEWRKRRNKSLKIFQSKIPPYFQSNLCNFKIDNDGFFS